MTTWLRKFVLFLFFPLALIVVAGGCGMDHSPVASQDEATVTQAEDGRLLLTFSPTAAQRAGKIAQAQEGRTSSKLIGAAGDTLLVKDENGRGTKDNLRVVLKVPENALAADELITMTVYGETLSDLVVEFAPGGLEFLIPAKLKLILGSKLIDAPIDEAVHVRHIHDDGTTENARVIFFTEKDNGRIRFKAEVPGFSRYSMGP